MKITTQAVRVFPHASLTERSALLDCINMSSRSRRDRVEPHGYAVQSYTQSPCSDTDAQGSEQRLSSESGVRQKSN